MAIGAAQVLATGSSVDNSRSFSPVTALDSALGSSILVILANEGGIAPSSVSDAAGNAYRPGYVVNGNGCSINCYFCPSAAPLAAGSAITGKWSRSNTSRKYMIAVSIPGLAGVAGAAIGASGSGTDPFIQIDNLAPGDQIAFGATFWLGGGAGVYTDDVNFTPDAAALDNSALYLSEFRIADQSSVYYSPFFDAGAPWVNQLIVLLGSGPPPPSLCNLPPLGPPHVPIRFGSQQKPTALGLAICAALGADRYRAGLNTFDDYSTGAVQANKLISDIALCHAGGFKYSPDIKYNPPGLPGGYSGTVPPDLVAYRTTLDQIFAIIGPDAGIAMCENEPNGNFLPVGTLPPVGGEYADFFAAIQTVADATAASYFTEFDVFIAACVAAGVEPTHGGISDTGIQRAFAYHLAVTGDLEALTEFLAVASPGGQIAADLPSPTNPGRPIFANTPTALYDALFSTAVITQCAAHGARTMNAHCFWNNPDICWEYRALDWARTASGLPLALMAVGQKTDDPAATVAITQLLRLLQPTDFSTFVALNSKRAFPYADQTTGALNGRGIIVRDAIAAYRAALTGFGAYARARRIGPDNRTLIPDPRRAII